MDNFKVSLVVMPLIDLRYPSLALAYLSAFLRQRRVKVFVHGFNLIFKATILVNFLQKVYSNPKLYLKLLANIDSIKNKKMKYRLVFIDLMLKYCLEDILKRNPDLVGFSVFATNSFASLLLARRIKERNKRIKIVFGGPECGYERNGYFFINTGIVDAVVLGEGELVLYELVKRYCTGNLTRCEGAIIKNNAKIIDGGYSKQVIDMDDLPFPDYSDLDIKKHIKAELPVSFNRGCTANCKFCFEKKYWRYYREMSVDRSIEMLEHMQNKYNISSFLFAQSQLNADFKWLSKFCDKIIERKLVVYWKGNARIHPRMDKECMQKMHNAGCRSLLFGVESGSQKILDDMGKGTFAHSMKEVIRATWESGIWVHTYWITGFPTETAKDLLKTLDFIIENNEYIDSWLFHVFYLVPGTRLYHEYLEQTWGGENKTSKKGWLREFSPPNPHKYVRSNYFLNNKNLIKKFLSVFNSFRIHYNLPHIGIVRHSSKKKKLALHFLLTVLLFKHALTDESLKSNLERIRISKKSLIRTYNRVIKKHGVEYHYVGNQNEIAKHIVKEMLV